MVVADILHSLGVSGSIVSVVVGLVALKHGREIFTVLSLAGMYMRVLAVGGFLLLLVSSGLVPGISASFNVQMGVMANLLSDLIDLAVGLVPL
ncbi:hypothetical protein VB773_14280 [Haloarculaceae archaeon H-GB2-1]|nr:hypothetical protein [Haloarculaceae archaeon H-GB1-1]MEA5408623.1 hypothetical protein [Haloarculaceae archaeon H-GB2-1]